MVDQDLLERRVLVLALTSKDAELTRSILMKADISCECYSSLKEVCAELDRGGGAVLLPEEAIEHDHNRCLLEWLGRQPPWSDLPILIVARPGSNSDAMASELQLIGNVTVLERPTRIAALVSAIRTALRARQRQYQIRQYLKEQDQATQVQARLAAIVESSADAIISKSLQGIIQSWNAGAERLFGYTAEETIGKSILILAPPDRHDEERMILDRLRKGERIEHFETIRLTKSGQPLDISLTISPIRDAKGKIVGASKVARDITQRKQSEAALRDADRRKDEFLAVLAHELRNPLAPIRNSLHILRIIGQNDPTAERVGEMMERQVNHMVRLVDDLMEVSRITRGKIDLRKELVEVAAIVRTAVETSRPLIESAGHQLAISIPPEPLTLEGDPVRLAQVFSNLLNNAAKYTDRGGQIWLTVKTEGDWVRISIRDTGTGIAQDMLLRVFEMFTQVDRQSGRTQGGLGIGLTLVKHLVEMHGGVIQARSEGIGKGSEFSVRLRLAVSRVPANSDFPESVATPSISRRVMVVDDNHDSAESLGMLLKLLGAEVHVVYNGPAALAALAEFGPSVVLLDIGMPGMDGYEVARQIRQQRQYDNLVLIALTGWSQEEDRRRSKSAGFDYHLTKPADVSDLGTLLLSIEGRSPSRQ